ncbi:GMC family oxidoreductase [Microbacterium testaceum]|uniref:GMC family oxidoreductase n=1 Tax=Microbacterium testaceum TaxID=2033 RepID=UPI003422C0DF
MDIGIESADVLSDAFIDTKHLMGGAVMGADPDKSVTDLVGRVHGTTDAWVVGASVFPSGGIANPTFTALALAERTLGAIGGA